jgi:8-oxo-dGTP diphosphatase
MWPVLLVRHGSAGERSAWSGPDRERPLDELGHRQAQALVPLLEAYRVSRVLSADVLRCLDTVGPFAVRHRLTVHSEPLMSETGFAAHPEAAVERLTSIVTAGEPTAVCSQGKAMPDLVAAMSRAFHLPEPADATVRKGGYWVMHLAANGKQRMAALERFDPPA